MLRQTRVLLIGFAALGPASGCIGTSPYDRYMETRAAAHRYLAAHAGPQAARRSPYAAAYRYSRVRRAVQTTAVMTAAAPIIGATQFATNPLGAQGDQPTAATQRVTQHFLSLTLDDYEAARRSGQSGAILDWKGDIDREETARRNKWRAYLRR